MLGIKPPAIIVEFVAYNRINCSEVEPKIFQSVKTVTSETHTEVSADKVSRQHIDDKVDIHQTYLSQSICTAESIQNEIGDHNL